MKIRPLKPSANRILKKTKVFTAAMAALAAAVLFAGCGQSAGGAHQQPISTTSFKLDTIVKVKIYDSRDQSLLDECMKLCDKYETVFSRTDEDSELYKLNHRLLPSVEGRENTYQVSRALARLLSAGLAYSRDSEGTFDIAIAPLTSLWDFASENPSLPDSRDIRRAVSQCGYEDVTVQGQNVTLPSPDTAFDLGAIAKGYIADCLKDYLTSQGVKSAIIDLGGNVLCIGQRPEGKPFEIGIQMPFADRNETIATVDIDGKSVVSSGTYERYFKKDGTVYHHILNPNTGYPYENDLTSVTVVTDKSVDGDALSTVCFALGSEKGLEYLESVDGADGIFITNDNQLHYTRDFQKKYPVKGGS